ncbi:MAG TPA: hypothetical protein VGD72_04110 [Mycobacteriales bacterium]
MSVPRRGRRPLVGVACAALLLLVVGSGIRWGIEGVAGSVAGLALVSVFFAGGRLPALFADRVPAALAFAALMLNYGVRLVVVLVGLLLLARLRWLEPRAMGLAVVLGAVLWSVVQVVAHATSRRPTIEPMGRQR